MFDTKLNKKNKVFNFYYSKNFIFQKKTCVYILIYANLSGMMAHKRSKDACFIQFYFILEYTEILLFLFRILKIVDDNLFYIKELRNKQ